MRVYYHRDKGNDIGFEVLIAIGGPYKTMTGYINLETFKVNQELMELFLCDSCPTDERKKYQALFSDQRLIRMLGIFKAINPNAIAIDSNGVFLALGRGLKHPYNFEVEGGVFVPYVNTYYSLQVVERIEGEDAFLYDTVVE